MVDVLLTSRFSRWMGWGSDLNFFYNDAYRRDTLGVKHAWALGRPFREVWSEIWDDLHPRIRSVLTGGGATWAEALLLILDRSRYLERGLLPKRQVHPPSQVPIPERVASTRQDGGTLRT